MRSLPFVALTTLALAAAAAPATAGAQSLAPDSQRPALELTLAQSSAQSPADEADASVAEALAERRRVARIHRAFGAATWLSMATTAVLGFIQLWDEYGLARSASNTPCAQGDAVMGFCGDDTPWPHAIAGLTTTALYATTFTLSLFMPDPLDFGEGDGKHARRVQMHKKLRWVHLAGMLATITLGAITANVDASYETRRALAWTHFGAAFTTFTALSVAGALMVF